MLHSFALSFGLKLYNTFYEAGCTWTSMRGASYRIDYVWGCQDSDIVSCIVDTSIDLSMNASQDHDIVVVEEFIRGGLSVHGQRVDTRSFKVDKMAMHNDVKRAEFESLMWQFESNVGTSINGHLTQLEEYTRRAAAKVFGHERGTPRKQWISAGTWELIKWVAPLRREMFKVRKQAITPALTGAFSLWRVAMLDKYDRRRWRMIGDATDCNTKLNTLRKISNSMFRAIRSLQKQAAPSLAEDRKIFLERMASQVQQNAQRGDTGHSYALARGLGSAKPLRQASIKLSDDKVVSTSEEVAQRWSQHHASVYGGTTLEQHAIDDTHQVEDVHDSILDVGPVNTELSYTNLGK